MATRPVFSARENAPFFSISNVEFAWNGGFAKVQKQKNIRAIHEAFGRRNPSAKVLEISSKSLQEGGEQLSAFFLQKYVPSLGKSVPVECIFQAGKVFEHGGPYLDLLEKTPREAKRDERLKTSGKLVRFEFEGKSYPLIPKTIFYDYIYINALFENPELAEIAMEYGAFTDIEFNPQKSINCQAKAAAVFVSLSRMGLIDQVKNFEDFVKLYDLRPAASPKPVKESPVKETREESPEKEDTVQVSAGMTMIHKAFGNGEIIEVQDGKIKVVFPSVGEKVLGLDWCAKNCQFE